MRKKNRFKPRVKRIVLNPEQAVLSCDCYTTGLRTHNTASNPRWSRVLPTPITACAGIGKTYTEGFRDEGASFGGWTLVGSIGSS
ncbi:MAG: hypothetical protein ABIH19_00880 [Candidatus Omnitrophota bacterium]